MESPYSEEHSRLGLVTIFSQTGRRRRRRQKNVWKAVSVPSIPAKLPPLEEQDLSRYRHPMYTGHRFQSSLAVSLPNIPSIFAEERSGRRRFEKINYTKRIHQSLPPPPVPPAKTSRPTQGVELPPLRRHAYHKTKGGVVVHGGHSPRSSGSPTPIVANIINTTDRTVEYLEHQGQIFVRSAGDDDLLDNAHLDQRNLDYSYTDRKLRHSVGKFTGSYREGVLEAIGE